MPYRTRQLMAIDLLLQYGDNQMGESTICRYGDAILCRGAALTRPSRPSRASLSCPLTVPFLFSRQVRASLSLRFFLALLSLSLAPPLFSFPLIFLSICWQSSPHLPFCDLPGIPPIRVGFLRRSCRRIHRPRTAILPPGIVHTLLSPPVHPVLPTALSATIPMPLESLKDP